ncbi:arylsulfatase [Pelagicoccus sp. SDUM812005]|uniref:arylsulfatase n=1 Tax=Pelagicoccus sp. SDUM812005 TaxID=3041257 RepID=UPI00280D6D75|nr:arylsulfatase [Pelagicoccus sp. SDUM812005]MDQ8183586.1 arylsulfatase [Pelagicoccus sp. SDUM812005]
MKLKQILVVVLGLLGVALNAASKPNIIFIMTDDQGYAPVGAHGHPWVRTPELDKMHAQSVRFDRFMMGSTCAPSRAGIMTGVHSIRNGVTHTIYERERLDLKATTIPEVLKSAGYTSGYFGKWHLGDEEAYQPENRGFDEVFIHGAGGIGQAYPGSCADVPGNTYFDPVFKHNGTFVKTKGFCTDVKFKATLGWIESVKDSGQPFFAYLSTTAPHAPFIAPPEYQKRFEDLGLSKGTAGFYGMIEHVDDCMGQMFEQLEAWGLLENTIVIFTSDNGMTSGGSGLKKGGERPPVELGKDSEGNLMMSYNAGMKGLKSSVDEGGVRVPFFVRWDGVIKEGRTVDTVVSYLDILPTLADLAGAELPTTQAFEGRSLKPLMLENNPAWEDRYLFQHVTRWNHGDNPDNWKWKRYSVRNQRFRLVEGVLYDMENDPEQNVDATAQFPEVVSEMKQAYERFWDESRPLMINENAPLAEEKPFHVDYYAQESSSGIPDWRAPDLKWEESYTGGPTGWVKRKARK